MQKGSFAEYDVKAVFIEFSNHTAITFGSQQTIAGTLRWDVTDSNSTGTSLKLSLAIYTIIAVTKVSVVGRLIYLENGTEWGYNPFWIDNNTLVAGASIDVSGNGYYLSVGRVDATNALESTPQGWQESYALSAVSNPKVFNVTLIPWYFFQQRTGLLVQMSADDPVWTLFGNFLIAGTVTLKATSIDLGPQSLGFIFIYLYQLWPLLFFAGVFVIGVYVYRRSQRRTTRKAAWKKPHH